MATTGQTRLNNQSKQILVAAMQMNKQHIEQMKSISGVVDFLKKNYKTTVSTQQARALLQVADIKISESLINRGSASKRLRNDQRSLARLILFFFKHISLDDVEKMDENTRRCFENVRRIAEV